MNVTRTSAPLGELPPGDWHPIDITVVNEGFVTGPLAIDATPVRGIELDLPLHELTGEHRQDLAFRFRFTTATATATAADVTLTFRALAALGGLANHSTIHLLLRTR
ncbi:hypothetical protein [Nocardia africana]|uniref:Uncharacterized protein n=1 Tax=Nocardia africana TaxID=134964 RepID=A0ABW6NTY5_9NOCA